MMAEKKLRDTLQQMPDVKPLTDKEELFQTISIKKEKKPKKKSKKLVSIPVFSTLFVLALVFLIVDEGENSTLNEQVDDTASKEFSNTQESMSQDSATIEQNELKSAEKNNIDQLVIQELSNNEKIVYGEVTVKQSEAVIPVSYVLSENNSKAVDEREINIFQNKLSFLFNTEQYQNKIYKKKSERAPLLTEKASFKLYKPAGGGRELLIPITSGETTNFKDAIMEMKKHETGNTVMSSIPKNLFFEINESETENTVQMTILEESTLVNDIRHQHMIEAILMTAKSYGYQEVTFISTKIDQIGRYQFNESIPVPIAVNPINSIRR
ncbi:hypothetical protein VBD025_11290 [Virgibacillus flavescens]|uniref:hypothetical protein n=1 Tax=Virgibacillus flavescens TaxID=1611422 RepID=UPI003D333519